MKNLLFFLAGLAVGAVALWIVAEIAAATSGAGHVSRYVAPPHA